MRSPGMFFFVFNAIYFAMNFYVFWRLLGFFGIRHPLVLWPLVILGMFSLTLALMLYYNLGPAFYPVFCAMSMWFGLLWLFFWCFLVLEPFRPLLRNVNPARIGTVVVALVAVVTIYAVWHAQHPRVVFQRIAAPVKLRLVQIADLHLGSTRPGFARKVAAEIAALKPDAVMATGDIIDQAGPLSDEGLRALRDTGVPVFAVLGNHERYAGADKCTKAMQQMGFTVLRGQGASLGGIRIYGMDDDSRIDVIRDGISQLRMDPSDFNILLFHHPVGFADAAKAGARLMLSGHTHHGQIFPFNIIVDYWYEHPYGRYTRGDSTIYTSQGTGTWGPRMRLGTDGEITVFDLAPEAAKP
jgi:uncharacterized protein